MSDLNLVVILGTNRKNNRSSNVADLVGEKARQSGKFAKVDVVGPDDFDLPDDGNDEYAKDPKYTALTERADAFFIVSPEYNHSFPGSLKRLLDSELKNYIHKAAAVAGVSAGPFGGVRAIEALTSPLRELGLVMTFTDVKVSAVQNSFDDDGNLTNENLGKQVDSALEELVWMAQTLKYGRENFSSE